MIETEGTRGAGMIGSDFEKGAAEETPLGRIGQPQDVATAAAFLASATRAGLTGRLSMRQVVLPGNCDSPGSIPCQARTGVKFVKLVGRPAVFVFAPLPSDNR